MEVLPEPLAHDADAAVGNHVPVVRIRRQCAVGCLEIGRQKRPRPLRRAVEAPDRFERAVPELEQPLAVRVLHLLSEIERRRAVRGAVEPGRVASDVRQERPRVRVGGARAGELASEAPHEREGAGSEGGGQAYTGQVARREQDGDRQREDDEQDDLCPRRRQERDRRSVEPLEQREAGRLRIEVGPHLVRCRHDEVERGRRRRRDRRRVRGASFEPERRPGEQQR